VAGLQAQTAEGPRAGDPATQLCNTPTHTSVRRGLQPNQNSRTEASGEPHPGSASQEVAEIRQSGPTRKQVKRKALLLRNHAVLENLEAFVSPYEALLAVVAPSNEIYLASLQQAWRDLTG
jgi:hypothetical protein